MTETAALVVTSGLSDAALMIQLAAALVRRFALIINLNKEF